jgi:hypothetical protein
MKENNKKSINKKVLFPERKTLSRKLDGRTHAQMDT